jgi:parallel beta-helix repeat protein
MIDGARKVTLKNNLVSGYANSWAGVCIYDSEEVDLVGNIITNNTSAGVALVRTSNINLYGNTISYNRGGIRAFSCRDGNMTENMIMMNVNCGVGLESSSHLSIFHNSFNNTNQVSILDASNNSWDNGYPSGGNYWSNYNGTDLDQDGIGDALYGIDANNTDNYPLMGMFSDFIATSEYRVQTICNSTITDFQFNGTTIRLNTSGQNGTFGFFRICIPKALMNDIYMFVDGGEVIPTLLPCSDSNNSYLYFNYMLSTLNTLKDRADLNEDGIVNVLDMCILSVAWNSTQADPQWVAEADLNDDGVIDDLDMNLLVSVIGENTNMATHEITIIPEFPSFLILPLFIIATLFTVTGYHRKRSGCLSARNRTIERTTQVSQGAN